MDEEKQQMEKPSANKPKRHRTIHVLDAITAAAGITFLSWVYKQWRIGVSTAPHNSSALPQLAQTTKADSPRKATPLIPPRLDLERSLAKFAGASFVSYSSVAVVAGLLVVAESLLRQDMAKVASQALIGLSSVPLMAASVALISISSIVIIAITAALPTTCIKATEFTYKSYYQLVSFSTQIPLAIAGVALPEALRRASTFSSVTPIYYHLWLIAICAGIAMTERILPYLVERICRTPKSCRQRFGTFGFGLVALLLLLVGAMEVIDWRQVTEPEKICIRNQTPD